MLGERVSVVIPLYNHARYISNAVQSVLAQGPLLRELIVIDDGSRDESAEVMAKLASQDSRIRFLRQENRGAHATINRGLELSSGEFVAILNSDDAYIEDRFATLVRALDLDPGSDIAASSIAFMDGDGLDIESSWFDQALARFKKLRNLPAALIDANFLMTTSNFLMRRRVLDEVGYFLPLRYAHDLEYALRLSNKRMRLCFIDRPLLKYRFHSSNTISENNDNVRFEWAICAALYIRDKYFELIPSNDPNIFLIQEILKKHNLLNAVMLCLDWMSKEKIRGFDERLIADGPFRDKMVGLVK